MKSWWGSENSEVLYRGILIDCSWTDEAFYRSAETLLSNGGHAEMHERILELAGYSGVDAEQAQRLVDECEMLFDRAQAKLDAGSELPPGTRLNREKYQ